MSNSENAIPDEGHIVTNLHMIYIHIPVPFDAPNIGHLRKFIEAMRSLSDKRVWIHCVMNYRVSAFLYQYWRLVDGVSYKEAHGVMLSSWEPNDVWKKFMNIEAKDVGL